MDSRHHQFGGILQRFQHIGQRRRLGWLAKLSDIGAGNKGAALAHQHQCFGVILLGILHRSKNAFADGLRQGIDGRAVNFDDTDIVDDFVTDDTGHE